MADFAAGAGGWGGQGEAVGAHDIFRYRNLMNTVRDARLDPFIPPQIAVQP